MEISKPDFKTDAIHEELVRKYWRVLKLARTPTREEFTKIATVAAAGVLVIGMVGLSSMYALNTRRCLGSESRDDHDTANSPRSPRHRGTGRTRGS